jgi:hypothetical protein
VPLTHHGPTRADDLRLRNENAKTQIHLPKAFASLSAQFRQNIIIMKFFKSAVLALVATSTVSAFAPARKCSMRTLAWMMLQ